MTAEYSTHDPDRPMTEIHSLDEIPDFCDEREEAAWWARHEFGNGLWRSLPRVPDHELPPIDAARLETQTWAG